MAAYQLLASQKYEIAALMTTVTEGFDRISMHGVRRELLERQAESLAIPLHTLMIPKDCSNEIYAARMRASLTDFKAQGIAKVAFGDLFLADVKQYREERLAEIGMTGLYPIWLRDTDELVRTFIGLGFKALLVCVDTQAIDAAFAGREIDHDLLRDLPQSADPCGENGEYHSFVYAGPIFKTPIACKAGVTVMRTPRFIIATSCRCERQSVPAAILRTMTARSSFTFAHPRERTPSHSQIALRSRHQSRCAGNMCPSSRRTPGCSKRVPNFERAPVTALPRTPSPPTQQDPARHSPPSLWTSPSDESRKYRRAQHTSPATGRPDQPTPAPV